MLLGFPPDLEKLYMLGVRAFDLFILAQEAVNDTAEATAKTGEPAPSGPNMWFPIIAIFLIFYFLVIRPEGKRRREREKKVKQLQKGDEVLTHGGIYGIVRRIDESVVELEVDKSNKVRMRFAKHAILDVLKPSDTPAPEKGGEEAAEPDASKEESALK